MNQPVPTGPDLFGFAEAAFGKAKSAGSGKGNNTYGSPEELYQFAAAHHHRDQALIAAVVMLTETISSAAGVSHLDLDGWRQQIGMTWRKECASMSARRPACAAWHTENCHFSDPRLPVGTRVARKKARPGQPHGTVNEQRRLPDGKYRLLVQWDGAEEAWIYQDETVLVRHEKLPVGTRVMVNDRMTRTEYGTEFEGQPWAGRIDGYADNRTCYLIAREWSGGEYSDRTDYIYMDERVKIHPDGPECPPKPIPLGSFELHSTWRMRRPNTGGKGEIVTVTRRKRGPKDELMISFDRGEDMPKDFRYDTWPASKFTDWYERYEEPTGPRMYVQDRRGKQGYVVSVRHDEEDGSLWFYVQYFTPGAGPVYKRADSFTVIASSQVERCPFNRTRDECGSGENQCEQCLAVEDAEAETIEKSMGV